MPGSPYLYKVFLTQDTRKLLQKAELCVIRSVARMKQVFTVLALVCLCEFDAVADVACAPGTVASVLAQGSCTIGDKTFDFTAFRDVRQGIATANYATTILFTPLTGQNPGFRLGGAVAAAGSYGYDASVVDFKVFTTSGASWILGLTATGDPATLPNLYGESDAEAYGSMQSPLGLYAYAYQIQGNRRAVPYSVTTSYNDGVAAPIGDGTVSLFAYNQGSGGEGTISTGDFRILSAPVPEPNSWFLIVTTGVALLPLTRKAGSGESQNPRSLR